MRNPEGQSPNPKSQEADAEAYCRELEAYLCRKNDGHLIRVVGPAFGQVCGWSRRGVPLKVAMRGIDRYFDRYYAKGPRRRPVRIEFCEADVLDVFDEWRRALGISVAATELEPGDSAPGSPGRHAAGSLPAHLERVIARLTALRAGEDRSLDPTLDAIVRELDAARLGAKTLRGDARERFLTRLGELDASLIAAVRSTCDAETMRRLVSDADEELNPFRGRMPTDAYQQAHRACVDRLLRDDRRLPTLAYE